MKNKNNTMRWERAFCWCHKVGRTLAHHGEARRTTCGCYRKVWKSFGCHERTTELVSVTGWDEAFVGVTRREDLLHRERKVSFAGAVGRGKGSFVGGEKGALKRSWRKRKELEVRGALAGVSRRAKEYDAKEELVGVIFRGGGGALDLGAEKTKGVRVLRVAVFHMA